MTNQKKHAKARWTLADLVDFEAVFVRNEDSVDAAQRQIFTQTIRPQLPAIADAGERRRTGLRLWLDRQQAASSETTPGKLFAGTLNAAGWGTFAILAGMGASVVGGLVLGAQQAVHVV